MITSDTAKHTSQAAFISEANAQRNASGWPDEETAELVRTYDPETQAVFIILLPVGRSHVHRVQVLDADATPAAIWTRHQGRTPITAA